VLKLDRHGSFTEAYNGPGELVWQELADKPLPRKGSIRCPWPGSRSWWAGWRLTHGFRWSCRLMG